MSIATNSPAFLESAGALVVPALVSATMWFIGAFANPPYGFFQLLRLLTCACGVWLATRAYRRGCQGSVWAMAALAVLLNPLIPVTFSHTQWRGLDLAAGLVFLACLGSLSLSPSSRLDSKLRHGLVIALAVLAIAAAGYGVSYAGTHHGRARHFRVW